MLREFQARPLVCGGGDEHAVASLGRSAAFGADDGESFGEFAFELPSTRAMPSGSVLSMKMDVHFVGAWLAQGIGDKFRAEGAAADADRENVGEAVRLGGLIFPECMSAANYLIEARVSVISLAISFVGARFGIAQPIMADHAILIGIGDRAFLQLIHRGKGFFDRRFHFREECVIKMHPAHIQCQIKRGNGGEILFVSRSKDRQVSWFLQKRLSEL